MQNGLAIALLALLLIALGAQATHDADASKNEIDDVSVGCLVCAGLVGAVLAIIVLAG